MTAVLTQADVKTACDGLERIAADLSMITDRKLSIDSFEVTRSAARTAAQNSIHISFKLGVQRGQEIRHGALLMPLDSSIALAAWLLMMPDTEVQRRKMEATLDQTLKDALQEIGNFVAGGYEAALRAAGVSDVIVRSEGCQGVRAGSRPVFRYDEGTPLMVGRARARLAGGLPFEMLLMLPPIN